MASAGALPPLSASLPRPPATDDGAARAGQARAFDGSANLRDAAAPHAARLRRVRDSGLATWATLTDATRLARRLGERAGALAPGLAIAAASSVACAATVTPACLRIGTGARSLAEGLGSLPVVGPMLTQALGASSYMGLFASSACLLSASMALLTAEGPRDQRIKWALAQACQGFGLSPFWLVLGSGALPAALPGLALALSCTVGVSLILADGLAGERPSWLAGVAMATLSAAGAPLGAQLALQVGLAEAMASSGVVLALGGLLSTFLIWRSSYEAMEDDSTAELRHYSKPVNAQRVLNLPGNEGRATVFVDDDELHACVQSIKVNLQRGGVIRNERLLLCGPPGTGKSQTVMAIANELGAPLFAPDVDLFVDDARPASKVKAILEQARTLAKRQLPPRPIVLCFDEAEKLFADRSKLQEEGTAKSAAANLITNTFNVQFEGINERANDNIVVVVCTNHPEKTDAAFQSRFRKVELRAPDEATTRAILSAAWPASHADYAGLRQFRPYHPSPAALDQMVEAIFGPLPASGGAAGGAQALVGRTFQEAINRAYQGLNARSVTDGALRTQTAFEQALLERFVATITDKRRELTRQAAPTGTATPGSFGAADPSATARHPVRLASFGGDGLLADATDSDTDATDSDTDATDSDAGAASADTDAASSDADAEGAFASPASTTSATRRSPTPPRAAAADATASPGRAAAPAGPAAGVMERWLTGPVGNFLAHGLPASMTPSWPSAADDADGARADEAFAPTSPTPSGP